MSISPSRIHPFQCCRGLIGQGEQLQFSVLIFLTIQLKQEQIVLERTARLNLNSWPLSLSWSWTWTLSQS